MIYHHLFDKFRKKDECVTALIGTGYYGLAILTQEPHTQYLRVPLVADLDAETAKNALIKAGIPEERMKYAGDPGTASDYIKQGYYVYTDNGMMAVEMPEIDVICESTGNAEAGARYCIAAMEHGKHVVEVCKEIESIIGPQLRKMAMEKGVVYTPVDGDQPGLIMGLAEWARVIGLEVIAAGTARDAEFVLDEKNRTVSVLQDGITVFKDYSVKIPDSYVQYFEKIPQGEGMAQLYIDKRNEILRDLPGVSNSDLCELTIAANALGLRPSTARTSEGILRLSELPIAYCRKESGGLYDQEGVIDGFTTLRRPDEGGMGGGEFIIVRCENEYSNYIMSEKVQIYNYDHSATLIYKPVHLCGVETSISILCAGLLGIDTGARNYKPTYDVVKYTTRDVKKGEIFGNEHDPAAKAVILPASRRGPKTPMSAHMYEGMAATRDIAKGEMITYDCVEIPQGSLLWDLRERMEEEFGIK